MAKKTSKDFEPTQEGEQNSVSNETTEQVKEVIVETKPDIIPAKEEKPNQEILNTPRPKIGMSLKDSWKHPSKFNN